MSEVQDTNTITTMFEWLAMNEGRRAEVFVVGFSDDSAQFREDWRTMRIKDVDGSPYWIKWRPIPKGEQ